LLILVVERVAKKKKGDKREYEGKKGSLRTARQS